jgi:hypothetical protein
MRRDQLEHAIRAACQIINRPEVIVVGSQSILGTFREDELPADATMSAEIDILPIAERNDETARRADLIEGVAGSGLAVSRRSGRSVLYRRTDLAASIVAASGCCAGDAASTAG